MPLNLDLNTMRFHRTNNLQKHCYQNHTFHTTAFRYRAHGTIITSHAQTCLNRDSGVRFLVLTRAWVEAWSIAATDSEVLDSMSSKTSSMFS